MTDDAELLDRYAADGAEDAFTELVRRHLNLVYFAALRRTGGNAHLAEDVAQGVFTALARDARALRRHRVLTGWLYVTTRHLAANVVRSETRRRRREQEAHLMQELVPVPTPESDWQKLRPEIDAALDRLKPEDRSAVLLRYFEHRPLAEIGASLQISENAARMRVERALDKLRVVLARRGITSTSLALATVLADQATAAAPTELVTAVASSAVAAARLPLAGTFKLLQIMSTTKSTAGLAVIATLFSLGMAIHEQSLTRSLERGIAGIQAKIDTSRAEIRRLQSRAQTEDANLEQLRRARTSLQTARVSPNQARRGGAAGARPGRPGAGGRPLVPDRKLLAGDPVARQAFVDWFKALTDLRYGPIFLTLGLSPDKIDALEALMMQYNIFTANAVLTLRPDGVTVAEVNQSIRDLLGDDYQQFADYGSTSLVRLVTDGLAGNLYDTAEPLSPEQADRLTQLLADNGAAANRGVGVRPGEINWDTALPQAGALLSPAQFAALKNEVQLVSGGPGPFYGFHSVYPGTVGNGPTPPPSGIVIPPPSK